MANAPWANTGYGVQGKHLVPRLQAMGHQVAYFSFYGLAGGMLNLNGVPIYPMGNVMWGEDILQAHMQHFRADILITLMDVWVTDFFGKMAADGGWKWLPWTPIDQEPAPDVVLERLVGAHTVLSYARWGEEQLRAAGVTNVRYIPLGVNTAVYAPLSAEQKRAARLEAGLPADAFVVGMVAANKGFPSRKCFPEQLLAFKAFQAAHPEAVMYLHTLRSEAQGGIDFATLLRRIGLVEGKDVFFTDQYAYMMGLPETTMAQMYNTFDVLSAASMGEGFGIPIVEAQACGVPVVTANNSAMPELTGSGVVVDHQHPYWTPLGAWAYLPDPQAITWAYEEIWNRRRTCPARLTNEARDFALAFDWDTVVDTHWEPMLNELEG